MKLLLGGRLILGLIIGGLIGWSVNELKRENAEETKEERMRKDLWFRVQMHRLWKGEE